MSATLRDVRAEAAVAVHLVPRALRLLPLPGSRVGARYVVSKASLSARELEAVRGELTVARRASGPLGDPPPLVCYEETAREIAVPRFYGFTRWGAPEKDARADGAPMAAAATRFVGALRSAPDVPQAELVDRLAAHLLAGAQRGGEAVGAVSAAGESAGGERPTSAGAMFEAPCGTGKTIAMIATLARLARRACIVVPTIDLLDQTLARLRAFLPDARLGVIHERRREIEDRDVIVASLCTLVHSACELRPDDLASIGTLWVDEAHHMSAEVFSGLFRLFRARFVGGQTATLRRADGTAHTLEWFMGPRLLAIARDHSATHVWPVRVPGAMPRTRRVFGKEVADRAGMLAALARSQARNELVARTVAWMLAPAFPRAFGGAPCPLADWRGVAPALPGGHPRRRIIVLVSLVEHATALLRAVAACADGGAAAWDWDDAREDRGALRADFREQPLSLATYVGASQGRSKAALAWLASARGATVIFATYNKAGEGFDEPDIDAAVLASPIKDVEQAVGRCERVAPGKAPPLVIDLQDVPAPIWVGLSRARGAFYARGRFRVAPSLSASTLAQPPQPQPQPPSPPTSYSPLPELEEDIAASEDEDVQPPAKRARTLQCI